MQVLLQTYIERLRVEDGKEINHHGKKIEIDESKDKKSPQIIKVQGSVIITIITLCLWLHNQFRLNPTGGMYLGANEDKAYKTPKILSVNEKVQREALKTYYEESVKIYV